ncbi:ABC transporter permease [Halobellus captivus]|uniref:ABC transporter permease n=1 Tax=Halobellus captivus TaxID=2592614 RepID=UPI00119FAAD7|nr:ABC transporter permease [Halobellus captivus]
MDVRSGLGKITRVDVSGALGDSDFRKALGERSTKLAMLFLLTLLILALFGPTIMPYDHDERIRGEDGGLLRLAEPSLTHPLGTTDSGYDVLTRLVAGARPTAITGLLGGGMIIAIGSFMGLTSGYVGGRSDDVLMRITDVVYAVPVIPFALVLVAILGVGFFQSILVIGLVLWRGSARVIRSQALQIREQPFILSAKAAGASTPYIIVKHVLPNVLPMAFLFFALGAGYTIILQAGLAFLGVSDPTVPSWGIMIRNAYNSGRLTTAWPWAIAPGLMISFTVLSLYTLGRGYENVAGDGDGDAAAYGAA